MASKTTSTPGYGYKVSYDPIKGKVTIKGYTEVAGTKAGISYGFQIDGTHTVATEGGFDVKAVKFEFKRENSVNQTTGAVGSSSSLDVSKTLELQAGPFNLGVKGTLNVLKTAENRVPTALDPDVIIGTKSLGTGVGIEGSAGTSRDEVKSGGTLLGIGAKEEQLRQGQGHSTAPILKSTVGTAEVFFIPSKSLLEQSPATLYGHSQRLSMMIDDLERNRQQTEPGGSTYQYYGARIDTLMASRSNLKLAEVYSTAERAREAIISGNPQGWKITEYDGGRGALFEHSDGTRLFVDRNHQRATYLRNDGTLESLNYTNTKDPLAASVNVGAGKTTSFNISNDGVVVVNNGEQSVIVHPGFVYHVGSDRTSTLLSRDASGGVQRVVETSPILGRTQGADSVGNSFDALSSTTALKFTRDPDATESPDSYVVQKGDNLWDIAERYGIPHETLRAANSQITHPDLIHDGQRIVVPGLGFMRDLEGQVGSMVDGIFNSVTADENTPPISPSPRLDENGMPLPEIKEGAAYDPNADPVYRTLLNAFRDAQAADQSIPADAVQVADAGTTMTDASQSYGSADPNAPPSDGPTQAPDTPTTLGNNFGEGANTDPLTQPAYSFSKPITDEALSQQRWAEANSYGQGFQSALSFIQALEQGNELSAAVAGVSMLNAFAKASGVPQADLLFSPTTTSSLGAISAAFNLRDALKADDNLAALAAGTNLSSQITFVYASYAESVAAETLAKNLGYAAGVLGIANSLKHGDEVGATASALMLASQLTWIGPWGTAVGLAIGIGRALFGGDDPPEPKGTAEVRWGADGSLSVAVTEDDDGGGKSALGMMQSMLDTLNGYLGQQRDVHGDPSFAFIPQRLPTVSFFQREYAEFMLNFTDENGQRITRHYNGQGQDRKCSQQHVISWN